ncbi:MAG TPA: hypothetical protein VN426_07960 [Syntrophomonadaceae bacterium]|nr:hypothetical protein [Syntrophomonadaceae bacterium]
MKGIKKRWVIVACIAVLAVVTLVSAGRIKDAYMKSKLDPLAELQSSISKTTAVKSYKYAMKSQFTVDGRGEVISEVQGEKNNNNTHIKGEMVNTSVDIYYIDRTIYNYDSFAQKWLVIESGTSNSEELLISELNPLSNFRFKHVSQVEKQGFEMIDGAECLVVTCNPSVEAQLLETMWKDISYKFWIDYHNDWIKQAVLTATNKKNPGTTLTVEVKLNDFDRNIEIKAPDVSESKK